MNTAVKVAERGVLEEFGVEMIGATLPSIRKAEDRDLFRKAMANIDLRIPRSGIAKTMEEARSIVEEIGYPIIVRPQFYAGGGTGGGVAYNPEDLERIAKAGLDASLNTQVMLEESVLGWKEYELEVMRDKNDNVVIVLLHREHGSHGDSHRRQHYRGPGPDPERPGSTRSCATHPWPSCARSGWIPAAPMSQFAIHPQTGEMIVVEMNPRVSRSSALASKATGFPIAKIAAKLAVGYTLDEIPNDITGETLASFEPTLDYCVVKIPRWTFRKISGNRGFSYHGHEVGG